MKHIQRIKELVLKSKKSVAITAGVLGLIIGGFPTISTRFNYEFLMDDKLKIEEELKTSKEDLASANKKIETLEAKVKEASPWFNMKEEERIAKEKAEKEGI